MSNLNQHTLVLNKGWTPISTTTVKRALVLTFMDAARIIHPDTYESFKFEDWCRIEPSVDDNIIVTQLGNIKVPDVIVLTNYQGMPKSEMTFSRRNILLRDNYECQYCGKDLSENTMTIDHVIPSSRGGKSEWINCVCSCQSCNLRKGDKTPKEADMPLLNPIRTPRWSACGFTPKHKRKKVWEKFLTKMMV